MMVESGSVSAVLRWLKPTPSLFVAVALATGFILFGPCLPVGSPQPIPNLCGPVSVLRLNYDPWIAAAFLLSATLAASTLAPIVYTNLKPPFARAVQHRHRRLYLRALTHSEKSILSAYINGQIRALDLFTGDPQLAGLLQVGILQQTGSRSIRSAVCIIEPRTWKYLTAHLHLIEPELSNLRRLATQPPSSPNRSTS